MSGQLVGKVAFITGGSRGIGLAIATAMAEAGATVVVASRSAAPFAVGGSPVHAISLDVCAEDDCRRAVGRCQEMFGALDVLVNNAGIAESRKFLDVDTDMWRRHMCVDVEAPLWLISAALPMMLARGSGTVISIGSVAGRIGLPYVAPYVAAKHALLGLTRALAAEYASSGITFNCVSPYYVDSAMAQAAITNIVNHTGRTRDEATQALFSPQGRLIQPAEVAAMCVFLASSAGRSITGQSLGIDGGRVHA